MHNFKDVPYSSELFYCFDCFAVVALSLLYQPLKIFTDKDFTRPNELNKQNEEKSINNTEMHFKRKVATDKKLFVYTNFERQFKIYCLVVSEIKTTTIRFQISTTAELLMKLYLAKVTWPVPSKRCSPHFASVCMNRTGRTFQQTL